VRSLVQHKSARREVSRMVLAGILASLTGFMIFRATYYVLNMRDANSILEAGNWVNALTPLSAAVVPIIGTTAFLVMCSERLQAELAMRAVELDQKNAALEQAIRAREDAERIARHDLKTPLASIAATPGLLRAFPPDGQEHEVLLSMIENAARRALRMVNLSLDLYQMEQGTYHFRPESVDLAVIVQTVMADLRTHAQSKDVRMELTGGDGLVLVAADASLCYSCIANLLKNAVEAASDHSCVVLGLQSGERVRLRIHNDTAVPEALRDSFFEKYATRGKLGGTGLGTYSALVMATVQGGTLSMQTSDSGGTTLILELNAFAGESPTVAQVAVPAVVDAVPAGYQGSSNGPMYVLVVDDDAYNCKVLSSQLAPYALQTDSAPNGRYALERALARRPDLIFMDIEMPVMGGVEAMQRIRELQRVRRQVASVIVAFSSDDDAASQARYLALGFDRCMSKPASQSTLALLLQATPVVPGAPQGTQEPVLVLDWLMPDMVGFLVSRLQLVDQLAAAAAQQDEAQVRSVSHKLGGSLAMFGFVWAADVCRQVESSPARMDVAERAAQDLAHHLRTVPILGWTEPAAADIP
jgi:CheY-like chemotaxis protein